MKLIQLLLIAIIGGSVLWGCTAQQQNTSNSSSTGQPTPPRASLPPSNTNGHDHAAESAVPRININDAKAAVDRGEALLLDVRAADAYRSGHITGAVAMPEAEIPSRGMSLPKDKKIITYCS